VEEFSRANFLQENAESEGTRDAAWRRGLSRESDGVLGAGRSRSGNVGERVEELLSGIGRR
jgi:hypothetical protein